MTAIMASLQVLSPIQELPEPVFQTTGLPPQRKNSAKNYFPKKKLARLHGIDPRIYKHLLLPISMVEERGFNVRTEQKQTKRRDLIIPKIIIEEVTFPDDVPRSETRVRTGACGAFLHPSHAVYSAVSANDPYALKNIILSGRVNVNQLNASGVTALHEASYEGKSRCVNVLVQLGADVDCRDREGWSPLHAAVCGGNHKCAAYLLRQGASIRAKNDDGLTPIAIAMQQRDKDMVQLLGSRQSTLNSSNNHRTDKRQLLKAHV